MPDEQGPADQYGPFTAALTGPLTPQKQQANVGYAPSKAGAVALFANKFLTGLQAGRRTAFERSEQTKAEHRENFNTVYAHILKSDQYSPEAKRAAEQVYNQTMGVQINEAVKGADKAHQDNPVMALAKSIGSAMVGPGENKKHKDYGDSLNALVAITRDPKFQVKPEEVGSLENALKPTQQANQQAPAVQKPAPSPTGGQAPQAGQQPGFNLPGAPTAPPLQASPQQAATPPPPGTTAAAAQAWKSKQDVRQDPRYAKSIQDARNAGIDWNGTQIGQMYHNLPETTTSKPIAGTQDLEGIRYGKTWNQETEKYDLQALGPAPEAKKSAAADARQQRIEARVTLGASKEDAEKEEAKYELAAADKKIATKPDAEDKIAKSYLDSGRASSPEEAKKMAAEFQVKLGDAQLKAKQRVPGSGGGGAASGGKPSLSADELDTLADGELAGLGVPQFGRGANDPNRLAYQRAKAARITEHGGVGGAIALRADAKSLQAQLTRLNTMVGPIDALSKSANSTIDAAIEASKNWPRDSSSLVNGWDQWLTKHAVDDPKLQDFIVKTETAANEYAKVIGNTTGASTDAARKQANDFIRTQLADKSYDAAANAMKSDMKRRIDGFHETIQGVKDSINNIGKTATAPPPGTAQPPKQDDPVDSSVKSIQVGGKAVNIGDSYKGKKILGFTKDHHLVTE